MGTFIFLIMFALIFAAMYFAIIRPQKKKNRKIVEVDNKNIRILFSILEMFFSIFSVVSLLFDMFEFKFLDGMGMQFNYFEANETLEYFGKSSDFQIGQIFTIIFIVFFVCNCLLSSICDFFIKGEKTIKMICSFKSIFHIFACACFAISVDDLKSEGFGLSGLFALPCIGFGLIHVLLIVEETFKVKKQDYTSKNMHAVSYSENNKPLRNEQINSENISFNIQKLNETYFCDKCNDLPDQLYKVTLSQGVKTKSLNLCKNCALEMKKKVDLKNGKN